MEEINIKEYNVYNDDGTFEGKKGNISLLSAHLMGLGVEGYGWSNQISLEKIKNESGNAVKVTSKGTHSIDYLYIKVDMPVKQGYNGDKEYFPVREQYQQSGYLLPMLYADRKH